MLNKNQKSVQIKAVNAVAGSALSLVVFRYSGLTVAQMNVLREQAREKNVHVQVVRNTLARLAFTDTPFECVAEKLKGPVMLAFALEEPGSAAKLVQGFMKDHELVKVEALSMGHELLGPESLAAVAKLPTREEALAMLARALVAPVASVARCHKDVLGRLVRVTSEVAAHKS